MNRRWTEWFAVFYEEGAAMFTGRLYEEDARLSLFTYCVGSPTQKRPIVLIIVNTMADVTVRTEAADAAVGQLNGFKRGVK